MSSHVKNDSVLSVYPAITKAGFQYLELHKNFHCSVKMILILIEFLSIIVFIIISTLVCKGWLLIQQKDYTEKICLNGRTALVTGGSSGKSICVIKLKCCDVRFGCNCSYIR